MLFGGTTYKNNENSKGPFANIAGVSTK